MSLQVTITGAAGLTALAAQIRDQGRKDLAKELGSALDKVVPPLRAAIRESAAETMPSGYTWVFTRSLAWRTVRRAGSQRAALRLITYADGRSERRDINRLERGQLRHPLHGDRDHWYVTSIRPGFHERGTDKAADQAVAALGEVVRDFSARLIS